MREQLGRDPGQSLDTVWTLLANCLPNLNLKPQADFPHKILSQFLGGGDFVARILWHE